MKGVILAGGKGLRLYPLTKVTNKHLLPVGREPMIFNPVRKLCEAGITDILVVTSTEQMGSIVNLLGSGKDFSCNFTYKVQDQALGIAHALSIAEDFSGNEKIVVILGDNITTTSIKPFVEKFAKQEKGALVLLKKVDDPHRFGVAVIDEKQVIEIEEKPHAPKSNFAVIGYYMYDSAVFDIIRHIKPSARGEYEISSVNNEYIKRGALSCEILDGEWTDAGTFESLLYASHLVMKQAPQIAKLSFDESQNVSQEQLTEMIGELEEKISGLRKHLK
ncbi:MAG: spore coat protein [Candidatus Moranbacteria bacterium RIFCSPHIGHO2_02_FULL_40_12b]|nr:MAG: spore coat protein [Candidatus Moranbacteria bacterium RIFCSPHIGHO2_02_FULL_40_12b]